MHETPSRAMPQAAAHSNALRIGGPLTAIAAVFATLPFTAGARAPELFAWLAAYSTPVAGKEIVVPLLVARGFDPTLIVAYLAALDVAVCALLLLNVDRLHRLPKIGALLAKLSDRVRGFMSRHDLARRGAFAGLLLHATVPHKGGGGVGSGLLGHTLGLSRSRVVVAVGAGGVMSGLILAGVTTFAIGTLHVA